MLGISANKLYNQGDLAASVPDSLLANGCSDFTGPGKSLAGCRANGNNLRLSATEAISCGQQNRIKANRNRYREGALNAIGRLVNPGKTSH